MEPPAPRKYDILITNHARERWVERVVDPKRYEHLHKCRGEGCEQCVTLLHDLRNAVKICGRGIDGKIAAAYRIAKEEGRHVTDLSFIEAVKKRYGIRGRVDFLLTPSNKVLVVCYNEEEIPVLKTILTQDMVDGFVIMTSNNDDMKTVFKRWRFENRHIKD